MKATLLIQASVIIAILFRQLMIVQIPSAPLMKPVSVAATSTVNQESADKADQIARWLVSDEKSHWNADEVDAMRQVLHNTFSALEANGVDGVKLVGGYHFRHEAGRYVDDVEGRMAKIDHNSLEITLSDTAFTVMDGFTIYHELGHAVDYQINRQLSDSYHRQVGSGEIESDEGLHWQTAYNYWLRLEGRDDREEAAADAFAVLVMSYAGLRRPIFPNEPITTDYEGISAAAAQALQSR